MWDDLDMQVPSPRVRDSTWLTDSRAASAGSIENPLSPFICQRGCAPRVPAPGHRHRVLQPQRLQAAVRSAARMGLQLLALQGRQGGHELFCRGWRAGSAHIRRQTRQDLLQLGMDKGTRCWAGYRVEAWVRCDVAITTCSQDARQCTEGICCPWLSKPEPAA